MKKGFGAEAATKRHRDSRGIEGLGGLNRRGLEALRVGGALYRGVWGAGLEGSRGI